MKIINYIPHTEHTFHPSWAVPLLGVVVCVQYSLPAYKMPWLEG